MAMKSDTCRRQTPTSPRSIVYQWQDTPVNEDVTEYMHKLKWTEEFIESIEWENDIPIWCGTCERTFNSDSQWKDHVRGKPHAKYLLDFRGQDPYLRKQGCPLFTKVRNETFYNSRFEGSKADTYVLATYLIKLMQELKETVISTVQKTAWISEDEPKIHESKDALSSKGLEVRTSTISWISEDKTNIQENKDALSSKMLEARLSTIPGLKHQQQAATYQ